MHFPEFSPGLHLSGAHRFLGKLFLLFLYNEYAYRTMNFCTGEELQIKQSHAIQSQTQPVISYSPALLITENNYATVRAFPLVVFGLIDLSLRYPIGQLIWPASTFGLKFILMFCLFYLNQLNILELVVKFLKGVSGCS